MGLEDDPLVTVDQLSEFLGKPRGTLDNWAYRGVGPRFIKVGGGRRYRRSDIEVWLEQNASRPRA